MCYTAVKTGQEVASVKGALDADLELPGRQLDFLYLSRLFIICCSEHLRLTPTSWVVI